MATESPTRAGYLRIIGAAVIWGSIGVFVRSLDLPVHIILFYRVLFASVTVFLVIVAAGRRSELVLRDYRLLVLITGAGLALNWLFFFYALKLTTVANAVFLTYLAPVLIALLAPVLIKESLERATVGALALSVTGMLLIMAPAGIAFSRTELFGMAAAIGSAVTYAVLVIASKRMLEKVPVFALMLYQNLMSALVLAPIALLGPRPAGEIQWGMLVTLGAVHTALAAWLYLGGLKQVKVQRAGVLAYIDPLSATVFAALFLGEKPGLLTLAGGVLILAAGYSIVARRPIEAPPH